MNDFLQSLFKDQNYDSDNFFLIAGPCVVENEELVNTVAEKVYTICKKLHIPYIFKASYKKANRTSATSFTGLGDKKGLEIIKAVGKRFSLPLTTDIHSEQEANLAAEYV